MPTEMRLQRVVSRKSPRRAYKKYLVTLPESVVRVLGWRTGGELSTSIHRGSLVLTYTPAKKVSRNSGVEPSYELFKTSIRDELKSHPEGRTWTQIRHALRLPQKVPNNVWVRLMEKEIGLLRLKSSPGTIWKLV